MYPGQNRDLNAEKLPPAPTVSTDRPSIPGSSVVSPEKPQSKGENIAPAPAAQKELERPSHEDAKTLLTVAAVGAGIIYYIWR